MSKLILCKICGKEISKSAKTCSHCGAKSKSNKLKFIFGGIASLIVAFILIIAFSGEGSNSDNNINIVKNGYLGNYTTVTVSKMLEINFSTADIKWNSFKSDNKTIVEVTIKDPNLNKNMLLQFSVKEDNSFEVVHMSVDGQSIETPYDVKMFLDGLYDNYVSITSDSSIIVDTNTSNNTLRSNTEKNSKTKSTSSNSSDKEIQDTKKAVELLTYLRANINVIKKDLGSPNKIDGAQSSDIYDYGAFYFVVNDDTVTSICIIGSGATANTIEIGMLPNDIKNNIGTPYKESNNNGFLMEYRFNNDATSIQYSSNDPSSSVNLITITDLTLTE